MAWVQQGGCRYYCRSVRKGRRVLHEYYGTGVDAELAAAIDQERRRRHEAEREGRRQATEAWHAARTPLDVLVAITDILVRAALLASGFHRHHQGEWRRRRERYE